MEKDAVACMLSGRSPACSLAATVTASDGSRAQAGKRGVRAWEFHVGYGRPHRLRGSLGKLTCRTAVKRS